MDIIDIEILLLGSGKRRRLGTEKLDCAVTVNQICGELLDGMIEGNYESVLSSSTANTILGTSTDEPSKPLDEFITSQVTCFLEGLPSDQKTAGELAVLCVGVSCLQLFVQNNWTGPPSQAHPTEFLSAKLREDDKKLSLQDTAVSELSVDGYPVYSLTSHVIYLYLAKILLLDCRESLQQCQTSSWWLLRFIQTQQALLDERSPTLLATVQELINKVSSKEPIMTESKYRDCQIQFNVEASFLMHFYYEPSQAKEHVDTSLQKAALQVELTGALGKRTRFQEMDTAQLVLQVKKTDQGQVEPPILQHTNGEVTETDEPELPKDVSLNDDTVLNQIQFQDPDQSFSVNLSALEQALILALSHQHKRSHEGQGDIIKEETLAYMTCILSQPKSWSVTSKALLSRTIQEQDSSRRTERSLAQLEELVNQCERPSKNPAARLDLIYASHLPPRWDVQKEQANLLMKVGATNAALEVFLRLEMWEEVIKCYQQLGRTEKAEKTIREQLAIKETPSLLCYLGDVLQEEEYYIKSWELSNSRFARAQCALGYLRLRKGEFEKCMESFEKSLQLNPLQLGVWFSYGCAAMALNKYDEAAKAFHRCVSIHTDNFEAWSNLATAYIRSGQKPRAFKTLQEALKWEYENWRLWENFLLVATDVGEFSEVLTAYHRLLDLKDKYADAEVLGILVRAVVEGVDDARGNSASVLRPKVQELMGRVTSKVTNDADIWRHYAKLLLSNSEATQSDRERALQYLQKSHRSMTQAFNWEKEIAKCKDVMEKAVDLASTYLDVSPQCKNNTQAIQLLSSARLVLRGIITKVKTKHSDPMTRELPEELKSPHDKLDAELQKILTRIDELKAA